MSKPKKLAMLYLKGMAMGAADVVPGVSGGTIAFITGIYEELIENIKSIGPGTLSVLAKEGVASAWRSFNGTFLLVLFMGIATSIFSLAKLITGLLHTHPIPLWSFFFGLILVSSWYVARQIPKWSAASIVSLLLGAGMAFGITQAAPATVEPSYLITFIAGSIAICAMILPGVSGSFILLIFGLYSYILTAVKTLQLEVLSIFALGCVVGLMGFSRFLSWMLKRYHELTLALLTGFMLGSLNKVWPWKQTLTYRVNSHGEQVPLIQENLSPFNFEEVVGADPQLLLSVLLAVGAVIIVLVMESVAKNENGG